jgi:hypothetical protein
LAMLGGASGAVAASFSAIWMRRSFSRTQVWD